jgi:uncharacterized protein YndB with AHSA1/START domain
VPPPRWGADSIRGLAALLCLGLLSHAARAETDPYKLRVRGRTDVQYPSYQGDRCTTIDAPKEAVWSVLVSPAHAAEWLLAGLDVTPLSAHYKKGRVAVKGDVLVLSANTKQGPRSIELTVLVSVENQLLAFAVTKDDDVMAPGVANLIYTFVLEEASSGATDLYWATHYDASSPLSAVVSPLKGRRRYTNRAGEGLLTLWGLTTASEELEHGRRELAAAAERPAPRPSPTPKKPKKKRVK